MVGLSSTAGCVLVMDSDFDRYEAAATGTAGNDAGSSGAAGAELDASPDADDASTGGSGGTAGGTGGTGGTGNTGGMAGSSGTGGGGPTCEDGTQNQGEENVDCGGPCPPCPVLMHHEENFNGYPSFGPSGQYTYAGSCANDPLVAGWRFVNTYDPQFTRASSYYAMMLTDGVLYIDLPCDDSLISPVLNVTGAKLVTIDFDSSFVVADDCTASVILVRNGVGKAVWAKAYNGVNQHITIGPEPLEDSPTIQLFFRYQGTFQYYWKVDNIVVDAR